MCSMIDRFAIAPKGRQSIATGASPWVNAPRARSPEGAKEHTPRPIYMRRACVTRALRRIAIVICTISTLAPLDRALAQDAPPKPLPTKEQIIRDRFQRLEDRMFRLREQLEASEPENAERLARALERAGALGLKERLDEITEILGDDARLTDAIDAQDAWLDQVDKVMAILLQRDSDNQQRKEEMERLEEFRERMRSILERQRAQRAQSAKAAALRQLREQLDNALRQLDHQIERQQSLAEQAENARQSGDPQQQEDAARAQEEAARATEQLGENVERLAENDALDPQSSAPPSESAQAQSAKAQLQQAAESLERAAESMQQAGESQSQDDSTPSAEAREQAEEELRRARDKLQRAKEELPENPDTKQMGGEQGKTADQTRDLADKMRQGDSQQGGENQQGDPQQSQPPGEQAPGAQQVERAEREMRGAQEDLEQGEPEDATEKQDRAIEQLEEAQQALEDELNQLRKEDREETLRDLESRFRAMAAKQRTINDETASLDEIGVDAFRRPEALKVAELAADQTDLAEKAATCLHILEEEGTTIVFPRIVEQLGQDMTDVARRLEAKQVGLLTQTMQQEVLDTLEQLTEAVQRMQRENEQQQMQQQQQQQDNENTPLLPTSAELKLLRASQLRVNTRTEAIEQTRREQGEPDADIARALDGAARRQLECTEIAEQMRERINQP